MFLSFFTGRYLIDTYRQMSAAEAAAPATAKSGGACPFSAAAAAVSAAPAHQRKGGVAVAARCGVAGGCHEE